MDPPKADPVRLERNRSSEWLNLEQLERPDMDLNEFVLCNFVERDGEHFRVDYERIEAAFPLLQQLQQRTCEEIAVSVDANLDQYVEISDRLAGLRDTLRGLHERYAQLEGDMEATRDALQERIYRLRSLLDNLKLIHTLDRNMNNLRALCGKLEELDRMLPTLGRADFGTLQLATLLVETRDQYHYQIDICAHCRQLCSKFQVVAHLNSTYQTLQNHLEQLCVEHLLRIKDGTHCNQRDFTDSLALVFQCFFVLNLPKLPEKLLIQFLVKPELDKIYQELLASKSLLQNESHIEKFTERILLINETWGKLLEQTLQQLPE